MKLKIIDARAVDLILKNSRLLQNVAVAIMTFICNVGEAMV
jgi:hypothetical protein